MNIDKFGHHVFKRQKMDSHSDYLICSMTDGSLNKLLKNIVNPVDAGDCVNKQYVDKNIESLEIKLKSINQNLTQIGSEINSIKQSIESVTQKIKKK